MNITTARMPLIFKNPVAMAIGTTIVTPMSPPRRRFHGLNSPFQRVNIPVTIAPRIAPMNP